MTNPTISDVLTNCSLSDESKLSALAVFAQIQTQLNCSFATFLRYLDDPARAGLTAFLQAMRQNNVPLHLQVNILAIYLDSQERGEPWTLQQFTDQLMTGSRASLHQQEEEPIVQRMIEAKPSEPAPGPAPHLGDYASLPGYQQPALTPAAAPAQPVSKVSAEIAVATPVTQSLPATPERPPFDTS